MSFWSRAGKSQKNITEIYQELSYDDLTQALNDYLNGGSTETKSKEEAPKTDSPVPNTVSDTKETSAAFDELFNS